MRREEVYVRGLVNHDTEVIKEIYDNYAEGIRQHIVENGGTSE
ncbi:MAG: sigma-70 family RNA polymerase sigma factor, partial [Bacteroidetes bacterium]